MNRRVMIFASILAMLLVTGGLTSFIAAEGVGNLIPGVLTVTTIPEASVNQFGGNQGWWFVLMVGFILFNLVGASVTGAVIFWFLSREVTRAKAEAPANHETIREAFAPRKSAAELPSETSQS